MHHGNSAVLLARLRIFGAEQVSDSVSAWTILMTCFWDRAWIFAEEKSKVMMTFTISCKTFKSVQFL